MTGRPLVPWDTVDRFMSHVRKDESGCWIWTAHVHPLSGYGRFSYGARRGLMSHVASYLMFVGGYAEDLDIDHLCRVRACCNPDHLEPVTRSENIRRGHASRLAEREVAA